MMKPTCKDCGSDFVTFVATITRSHDGDDWEVIYIWSDATCAACGSRNIDHDLTDHAVEPASNPHYNTSP